MPISRTMAESMLLDTRALVILMGYVSFALQQRAKKIREHGQELLKDVKRDLKEFSASRYEVDDLASQYNLSITLPYLEKLAERIERREDLSQVENQLRELRALIEERLYEPFSEGLPETHMVGTAGAFSRNRRQTT